MSSHVQDTRERLRKKADALGLIKKSDEKPPFNLQRERKRILRENPEIGFVQMGHELEKALDAHRKL